MNCIIHNSFLKNCNCKFQAAQLGVNFCEFTALTCGGGCPSSERTLPAEALRLAQGVNVKMNVVLETATGVASAFQSESKASLNGSFMEAFMTLNTIIFADMVRDRKLEFHGM
jgi:hypothetical protein